MVKRKSDEQLRNEINLHSKIARELSHQSHEIHMSALNIFEPAEHRKAMQTVIELQRLSIKEAQKVIHLQKILFSRQLKTIKKQKAKYVDV